MGMGLWGYPMYTCTCIHAHTPEVTLIKISKLEGDLCANFPRICTCFWLFWTEFVGLNGSKNSGEIDTKFVFGTIYFW